MKYRKKPVTVEVYQTDKELVIHTLEGDMKANVGDYIITGVNGEQYPCKPDIFEKTYEPVTNTNFDRIKAMSVEKMAEFISKRPFCVLSVGEECLRWQHKGDCKEHARQYLESEVQEDDT